MHPKAAATAKASLNEPNSRTAAIDALVNKRTWWQRNRITALLVVIVLAVLGSIVGPSHKQEVAEHPCSYGAVAACDQQHAIQTEEHTNLEAAKRAAEEIEAAGA